MKVLTAILAATFLSATTHSYGQQWKQEPETFLGIKLSAPLQKQLQRCPASSGASLEEIKAWYDSGKACYQNKGDRYEVFRLPQAVPWGAAYLTVEDGNVEGVNIRVRHEHFPKLRELFMQKYGLPTFSDTAEYRNMAGAVLKGERLIWDGERVNLLLTEYSDNLEASYVEIQSQTQISRIKSRNYRDQQKGLDAL